MGVGHAYFDGEKRIVGVHTPALSSQGESAYGLGENTLGGRRLTAVAGRGIRTRKPSGPTWGPRETPQRGKKNGISLGLDVKQLQNKGHEKVSNK
jgi:hypothetical protein